MSLAVLFPGQGSIVPGAGAPWVDHPAWSVVPRSRPIADRPSPRSCSTRPPRTSPPPMPPRSPRSPSRWWRGRRWRPRLDRGARRLRRPLARAGHGADRRRRRRPRGGHRPGRGPGRRLPASDDARPGRLAALLGATLEQAAEACAPRRRLLDRQRQRPRAGRDRRHPDGPRAGRRGRPALGVRKADAPRRSAAPSTRRCSPAVERWRPMLGDDVRAHRRRRSSTTPRRRPAPTAPWAGAARPPPRRAGAVARVAEVLAGKLGVTELVELAPAGTLTAMAKRTIPDVAIRPLDASHGGTSVMSGEVLHVRERIVLSPVTGRFVVDPGGQVDPARPGHLVLAGSSVGGVVGSGRTTAVTTPFTGVIAGCSPTGDGERVSEGRPARSPGCGSGEQGMGEPAIAVAGSGGPGDAAWRAAASERTVVTNTDLDRSVWRRPTSGSGSPLGHRRARWAGPAGRDHDVARRPRRHRRPEGRRHHPRRGRLLLVLATCTPDQVMPHSGAAVCDAVGLTCGSFDVNGACAGFVDALVAPPAWPHGPRPGRGRRLRADDVDRRPRRPVHRGAVRRRGRRPRARRPATATCSPGTPGPTARCAPAGDPGRRAVDAHGRRRGVPPGRAHHLRLGDGHARPGRHGRRRRRPLRAPPGQRPHHRGGPPASASRPTGSSSTSTGGATPRRRRSPSPSPRRPPPAASAPATTSSCRASAPA